MPPQSPATQRLSLLWSPSPAGPPVDVGMRIDVASIDMVSEVNMVSGLPTARRAAELTQMRNGPVLRPLLFIGDHLGPGPQGPTSRVRPTPLHTLSITPQFVFSTHTGYCGVPKETYSALFWEGRGTVAPEDWLGRSLNLTLTGSPCVCVCGGGGDVQGTICRRSDGLHMGSPGPGVRVRSHRQTTHSPHNLHRSHSLLAPSHPTQTPSSLAKLASIPSLLQNPAQCLAGATG